MIVPCSPDAFSIGGTMSLLMNHPFKNYKVLLTLCEHQGNDPEEARKAFEDCGHAVFKARIRRYSAYRKAQVMGTTVADLKKDSYASRAWGDIVALGEEIFS